MNRLQEAILKYRQLEDDDSRAEMYRELYQAEFFLPVLDNSESQTRFYILKNRAEERYLLAFSSLDKIEAYLGHSSLCASLRFETICRLLKNDGDLSGILLDPNEGNMVFEKDLFEVLEEIMLSESPLS